MSQRKILWILWMAGLSVVYLGTQPRAHADVELPLLNQVPKIISVSEQFPLEQLERFRGVQNMTLELRLTRGNIVPDLSLIHI